MPPKPRSRKGEVSSHQLEKVLFLFASWLTCQYNIPGLNREVVESFCNENVKSRKRKIFSTVLDVDVTDDLKSDAESAGVTLIPATQYPENAEPKIDWLLYPDTHFGRLRDLKNVKYVVGHNSKTATYAATAIRDNLFPNAELYLLKVDPPGALVVFDSWDVEKYGLPDFHRTLLKDLCTKRGKTLKMYATVVDVAVDEDQKRDAEKVGITLIPGTRPDHMNATNDPKDVRWLFHHLSYYKQLKDLRNIEYVIGYAPMTADAAANIRRNLFPTAKLYQINAIHPDYHSKLTFKDQNQLECDMLRIAEEADAMVSIGPSMYKYFDNAYRAIGVTPHFELVPNVGDLFQTQSVELGENISLKVILSYGGEQNCDIEMPCGDGKIAMAIGKVAADCKHMGSHTLKWNILDVPVQSSATVEANLRRKIDCDSVLTVLKPPCPAKQLLTFLLQSHLCITRQCHADFGFYGLEAMAAGLPSFTAENTQLGCLINEYFPDFANFCLMRSEQDWFDKVMRAVQQPRVAFNRAKELQKAYMECGKVVQSYARFAALYTVGVEPSEGLSVIVKLNTKRILEEMLSRQQPADQHAATALRQALEETQEQCRQLFKRKVDQMISEDIEQLKRLGEEGNFGVIQVTMISKKSLGMLLNFLSILGLYRFKSSVQTGRFAEAYEPWLITDEMREIAAKVNVPLKLEVTYDEKKFDELDANFIARDGRISDSERNLDGESVYKFEKQPPTKLLVEQSAVPLSKLDTDIEDKLVVEDLEQTGRQRGQQTHGKFPKSQLSKAKEGKDSLGKQHEETLKEVDKANKDDQLDITMRDINQVMKEMEKANKEAEVLKTQLDELKVGKSQLDKQNQERLEELGKAEKVATDKAMEITSLKKEIHDLETKLAESSDLVAKMQAQLSDAETNLAESRDLVAKMQAQLSNAETELAESRDLVAKMQVKLLNAETEVGQSKDLVTKMTAKLSDAENRAMENNQFDNAEKETAHLKDQLDKATKVVTQLEDQLEIVVEEKSQIQEELDKERRANVLLGAGKQTGDLERGIKEKSDSGGVFTKLRKFVTGNSEPKPIGTKRYIGKKEKLDMRHGGHKWTLQVLGSWDSGTEPGQFNAPRGLAWHGDQLVICDTENHRIQILNKNKVVIEIIRFDGQFDEEFRPYAVAISPDGHLFITDIGNNQIIICDQNKKIIQIIPQSADIEVRSITVMAAFIFITDSKGKSLIKYSIKDGKLVARVSDQFSDPRSVMATSNNHLLVSDRDKHVIHVLDSDLNFLNSYRNDRLKYPRGLDVDSHGNIYIGTSQSTGIVKLRSDGQLDCVLFEGFGYYPEFIAVNDDITTTIALTGRWLSRSDHQISVFSVST